MFSKLHLSKRTFLTIGTVAVVVVAVLTLLVVTFTANSSAPPSRGYSELSAVPGFGRTPEHSSRDYLIVTWQSYKRKEFVANCMKNAGFDYKIELSFAPNTIADTAEFHKLHRLGIAPSVGSVFTSSPAATNRRRADNYPAEKRNDYYIALRGVTAEEFDTSERNGGLIPRGAPDDFMFGGCVGQAEDEIPYVWALKRKLSPEINAQIRALSDNPKLSNTRKELSDCAAQYSVDAQTMAELELSYIQGIEGASQAVENCEEIWREGMYQARVDIEDSLLTSVYADEIKEHSLKYENAVEQIKSDKEFVAYILAALAEFDEREHAFKWDWLTS